MKTLVPISIAIIVGVVAPSRIVQSALIQAAEPQFPQRWEISEEELKSFAKAYAEFQKIRLTYENSVEARPDKQEETRAQHEALIKIDGVLQKQGLGQDDFVRIFEIVKADETLWEKTMKLVEAERRAAG
jgi:hypothetical protein